MGTQLAVERLNRPDLESEVLDSRSNLATPLQQDITGRTPITTYVRLAGITVLLGSVYALAAGYLTSNKSMLIWGAIGMVPGIHLTIFPRGYGLFKR